MLIKTLKVPLLASCSVLAIGLFPCLAAAQEAENSDSALVNETILVTASKREQSLREVPGSISALSESALQDLNAQSLSDYITRIPGVVFNDYQPGVSEVVIRGVASTTYHEANQTATGYYLNEIPLIEPGFPLVIPDVDSFDLKRVEVLRGPQGTLFGSSSLGGAINYVAKEADPSGMEAALEGMIASTKGVDELSYAAKGMINLPVIKDKLAVRLVGLQRFDSGYLDNTLLGEDGSNDLDVDGLRASVVYTPNETTRISALSMYQKYSLDDQTYVLFGADPETYERATNVAEYQNTDFMLHSLRLDQEFDFATLTVVGSYVEKSADLAFDYSIFGGNDPRTNTPLLSSGSGESTTDYLEVRLTSPDEGRLTWIVGANYTKLKSENTDALYLEGIAAYIDANPAEFNNQPGSLLAPGDLSERTVSSNSVTEQALFGEIKYAFSDQLSLTLGGRLFEYESSPRLTYLPNANLIDPFDYQPPAGKESSFVPKVSLTYTPNDDIMVYALYSEGFRIGGVNVYSVASPDLPLAFGSDATKNYEIGTRIDLMNDRIFLDATVYHIDWEDVQARLFTSDYRAYTVNGGGAEIDGVELVATIAATQQLNLSTSISYNDARLSSLLPGENAPAGTRLPGASEWTIANTASYRFDTLPWQPFVSLNHRYLSEAPVDFAGSLEKGDYHIFDLNASFDVSSNVQLSLFAKNLLDEYGILNAPFAFAGSVTRPRSIGMSLRYNFN
ncbi:TonB-dependent receptor [Hyphomonas sp. NPDC076900]|uniref:TonB-dependent receptor n=1 Tax=unclassified Hyphomonas TaxID=2630699 RepID=UPI003D023C97